MCVSAQEMEARLFKHFSIYEVFSFQLLFVDYYFINILFWHYFYICTYQFILFSSAQQYIPLNIYYIYSFYIFHLYEPGIYLSNICIFITKDRMSKRTESQQLIMELRIRFEKKPRKCKKINDSGIGHSERIVYVANDRFYYFQKIQEFNDLDFDKLQYAVPKAGIELSQILELRFPPRRTNERNYFTITIPNNKIYKYTKAIKQVFADEHAEGEQDWTFVFDYDIISLPQYEKRLQVMKLLENEKILKKKQKEEEELMKKQEQIRRKMEQQYQSLVQTQKLISEKQKQGQQFTKKKSAREQSEEDIEKFLTNADQLYYHQAYVKLIKGGSTEAEQLDLELDLLQTIGKFRKRAQNVVRKYIDQLPFNVNPTSQGSLIIENLYLKIGVKKHLNLQFLDIMQSAHAIYNLRQKLQIKIRVPLTAFIKYKGMKVLARSMTPCDLLNQKQKQQSFLHGNYIENWKTHFFLVDDLNSILQSMNLKPYNSERHFQRVVVHFGTRLQIMQTKKDPFANIIKHSNRAFSQLIKQKIVYAFNISQVFPIDLDLQKNIKQDDVRLRPQFVQSYKQNTNSKQSKQLTKLVGGALTYLYQDEQGAKDDVNLARASQNLKYVHIVNFVQNLDKLKYIPMSSEHLRSIIKQNGINIRYISTIYKLTSLPYIRQMITIEAIAREVKKIYRDYQKDFIEEVFRTNYSELIKQVNDRNSMNSLKVIRSRQLLMKQKQRSMQNSIDFLNLVFGNGEQSQNFWIIIKKKVKDNYKIHIAEHTDLSHGYLLTTILYHCCFGIKLNSSLLLFSSPAPFVIKDWVQFKCKSQTFTFPSLEVYKKCKITSDLTQQAIINRLELNLIINRALHNSQSKVLNQLSTYTRNPEIRSRQKYTIESLKYYVANASAENFQTAYDICTFVLPKSHPYFQDLYLQYAALKTPDSVVLKKAAENHSIRTLGINHWKTSSILTGFKEESFLKHLIAAQSGVELNKKIQLYHKITEQQARIGKFSECFEYVRRSIYFIENKKQISIEEQEQFFKILMIGMEVTYKLRNITDMLKISQYFWTYLEKYRQNIDSHEYIYHMMYYTLRGYIEADFIKKYYIFKVVLILNDKISKEKEIKRQTLLKTLREKCRESKNHVNWFNQLLNKLQFAYSQINFLPDFFTNFFHHVKKIESEQLQEGLEQLQLLVRIFKKKYFEEALLDRSYTFRKETNWQMPDNSAKK